MPHPIGDTKRAELREITVIKNQNEMSRVVAEALEYVGMATWKVPDIARFEVIRLGLTGRVNHSCASPAFEHKRPLGRSSVPVKLAHHARLELHGYTGDSLGDGKLLDSRFLSKTVSRYLPLGFLQFEFKRR